MKTRLLYLLLLLTLPAVARAQFTYTTNGDGTLNISQYTGSGGAVTIPNTSGGLRVTSIGVEAFSENTSVTSVTIGTNVITIGENAFFQCFNLTSASIPASVTNIGLGPFEDCQKLTTISMNAADLYYTVTNGVLFNKTLTSIIQFPCGVSGSYTISQIVTNLGLAFSGNTLTSISVNPTNTYYSSTNGVLFDWSQTYLFNYPGGAVGSYTVPNSVTNIWDGAFEFSIGVTNVTIGTNVTSIGYAAFYDSAGMTAITVNPANAYYSSANGVLFDKAKAALIQYPCDLAGAYTVPGTVTNIEDGAFGDCFGLTNVVIPDSVTSIGFESFYGDENLQSATFGGSLASIGEEAFFECLDLNTLMLPDSLTNISDYAFYYCQGLTSVTFGTGLQSIGFEAFAACQSLTNACFSGNMPLDGGSVFYFDTSLATILYVNGTTGWGPTYDGITTAPCPTCGGTPPTLTIVQSGANVIVSWPSTFTGFTLESTTNLDLPAAWSTNSPTPTIVNANYTVTNQNSGTRKFYRLIGP